MRIAICDDERASLDFIAEHVQSIDSDCEIATFLDISKLFHAIESGIIYDAVFMDVEWHGEQKGIDYAAEIFDLSPKTVIIFITGHPEQYSQKIFLKKTNLKGFISKPPNPTILSKYLEIIKDSISDSNNHKLTLKFNTGIISIDWSDILYIESHLNTVTIHTYNDSFRCYEKISTIVKQLSGGFFRTHKSFVVNMDKIKRIERNYVLLQEDKRIPISKHRLPDFRKQYGRYIGLKV